MQRMARGRGGVVCWGVEGRRAAKQAEVFLIMLRLECFPASALTSCCLFPCSVPAPIPALKPASVQAGLGKLLLSPMSPHPCSAGLGSLGAAARCKELAGGSCRLALLAVQASLRQGALPGRRCQAGRGLPGLSWQPFRLWAACVLGFSSSACPGRAAGSHCWGLVAVELLGFSCQLGGGSTG